MPQVEICRYCQKRIDRDEQDFVVTNKLNEFEVVRPKEEWVYAHADCYEKEHAKGQESPISVS